jgi:hypothetical protein
MSCLNCENLQFYYFYSSSHDLARFSLAWLMVMTLFPVALLLLKFDRGRLPRKPQATLSIILGALVVAVTVFVGTITINLATLQSALHHLTYGH